MTVTYTLGWGFWSSELDFGRVKNPRLTLFSKICMCVSIHFSTKRVLKTLIELFLNFRVKYGMKY